MLPDAFYRQSPVYYLLFVFVLKICVIKLSLCTVGVTATQKPAGRAERISDKSSQSALTFDDFFWDFFAS